MRTSKTSCRIVACLLVLLLAGMACQISGSAPSPTSTVAASGAVITTTAPAPTREATQTQTAPPPTDASPAAEHTAQRSATQLPTRSPVPASATLTVSPTDVQTAENMSADGMLPSRANREAIHLLASLTNGDFGKVSEVVWSPDGERLAVLGDLGIAMLDAGTLETLWRHDYSSKAPQMRFSLDGKLLVIADGLGYVTFFQPDSGEFLEELEGTGPIAISPDGQILAYSVGWGVQLLDWKNDQELTLLESAEGIGDIVNLDFSADGQQLMAGSWDRSLQVWQVADGTRTRTSAGPYTPDGQSFCYAGDGMPGNTLVLVCLTPADDYQTTIYDVWMWDVNDAKRQNVVQFVDRAGKGYSSFSASPDRQNLGLFAADQLEVWSVVKGFALNTQLPATRSNRIAFNPADGGQTLVAWDIGGFEIWNVSTQSLQNERREWIASINAVAFSPAAEGRLLAAGNSLGEVQLWDAGNGQKINTLQAGGPVNSLAFSQDGILLAADGDQSVVVWRMQGEGPSAEKVELVAEFPLSLAAEAVALSPDGEVVSVGGKNTLEVWNIAAQTRLSVFPVTGTATRLAISPDGKILAAGLEKSSGCVFILFDLTTGKQRNEFNIDGFHFNSLSFSPDGLSLLLTTDARLQVWDIEQGKMLRGYHFDEDGTDFFASAFSPDQCLIGLSANNDLEFYDLATADFYATFRSHAYRTYSVAFSPDGRLVATGGADGAVRLWGVTGVLEQIGDPANLRMCPRVMRSPTPTPTVTPSITPPPSPTPFVTATPTPTPPAFTRNLYLADPHLSGEDVLWVQQRLLELGYTEVGTPDGDFGSKTEAAVRHFQQANGLEADGVVGPKTWDRLFSPEALGPG